eukprot:gb/GEZJ01008106.1/.p1 GENE.gb/GEZJ01008106.1/~~gb/GEZJ01008106.1/.p1  ORF type:complete len:108 (+),score=12.51 gb/GEZJ01008106.1/:209-532(+)
MTAVFEDNLLSFPDTSLSKIVQDGLHSIRKANYIEPVLPTINEIEYSRDDAYSHGFDVKLDVDVSGNNAKVGDRDESFWPFDDTYSRVLYTLKLRTAFQSILRRLWN